MHVGAWMLLWVTVAPGTAEELRAIPDKCALFGKIEFVEHFADVKVQIVEHFPDIEVE